jgi:hypothetical protein
MSIAAANSILAAMMSWSNHDEPESLVRMAEHSRRKASEFSTDAPWSSVTTSANSHSCAVIPLLLALVLALSLFFFLFALELKRWRRPKGAETDRD